MLRAAFLLSGILAALLAAPSVRAQSSLSGSGTGFFINGDGWAVTNAHVLEGCTRAEVPAIGAATDWIVDRQNDVAVVKVQGGNGKPHLRLRGVAPRLGDDVAAFGYPFSDFLSDSIKITTGNISSLIGAQNDSRFLQISTPLQPGNSGGPVVDRSGAVLGIATAVYAGRGDFVAQNVNFAVRSNVLELFLQSHRVAYETAAAPGEPLATADLADAVSPAVIQIQCFGRKGSAPQASRPNDPAPSSRAAARTFRRVNNHDVMGFDYQTLRSVSLAQCQSACEGDRSCKATTYNTKERFCFLKSDAKLVVSNADAVAHVADELAGSILISTFVIASGRDMAGGDHRLIRSSDFIGCYLECELDRQCRAFAYVRKQNQCWLKNRLGNVSRKAGVDLGVK